MPIRLSGINSGLDTDALVKELVSAYSLKKEKYQKEQTKIEWKQEAWKSLNTKIYSLYTSVSNLRYDSAYNLKKSNVSDTSKAKVTAGANAPAGTQTLNVKQMAQAAYVTGAQLTAAEEGTEIKSTTKLSELGYGGAATKINVKGTEIALTKDSTIADVVKAMGEAGVNANFDEKNGRIFVSAKESGLEGHFDITADSANGNAALYALGLLTQAPTVGDANQYATQKAIHTAAVEYAKDSDGDGVKDETATVNVETYKAYLKSQITDYVALLDEADGLNTTAKTLSEERVNLQKELDTINATSVDGDDGDDATLTEEERSTKIAELQNELETNQEAINKNQEAIEAKKKEITDKQAEIKANQMDDDKMNYAPHGLADLVSTCSTNEELNAALDILVSEVDAVQKMESAYPTDSTKYATRINAQNAKITLNGVAYESNSNSFSINGLTIEVTGVTDTPANNGAVQQDGTSSVIENPISITTTVDTQGIYDKVKDFLTEYNNVINEITKLYNADSAKDYQPLTDEEKDAMSDEQIEKWETKIKDALLRRDSSLSSIMNAMVNSMSKSITIDGKSMNLSDFGIKTLGFLNAPKNEQYAYHIDGDEDDENTSGKEDKLMKAIQEDPDSLCKFMKELASNLYTAVDQKMKSTELSSAYKVYNDKELDTQLKKYKDMIKDWEEKVSREEEYYYNKFSQMEVALSKLQNQTNSLAGLIGQ